jgi:DNA replication protein
VTEKMTHEPSFSFGGFREDNLDLVRLPAAFFSQLLPNIEDIAQLRLLLYLFWHNEQQESKVRYFRLDDLSADPALLRMIGNQEALKKALSDLEKLGALLRANLAWMDETYYFINGPQGRASVEAIEKGNWQENKPERNPIHLTGEAPNIFKLYEENIGPITPMMAEILKDDEATYPISWIEEAIQIAVTRNARNWKYVRAILDRWQNEGRGDEQNRRDHSQDPDRYRKSWLGRK